MGPPMAMSQIYIYEPWAVYKICITMGLSMAIGYTYICVYIMGPPIAMGTSIYSMGPPMAMGCIHYLYNHYLYFNGFVHGYRIYIYTFLSWAHSMAMGHIFFQNPWAHP